MFRLQYVFRCRFRDGTWIFQTPEDVSATDPTRSAFYDVAQRISEVEFFSITNGRETLAVDLRDGRFEVNGVKFSAGNPASPIPDGTAFELVYYRRRREHFTAGLEHVGSDCDYCFGWKAEFNGTIEMVTISVPHVSIG